MRVCYLWKPLARACALGRQYGIPTIFGIFLSQKIKWHVSVLSSRVANNYKLAILHELLRQSSSGRKVIRI